MKMERPEVSKPRKATWATDDAQLKRLLDHLLNKTLNTDTWSIYSFSVSTKIKYPELIRLMHNRYPDLESIEIARDFIINLPKKMQITREDLVRVFKAFLINTEERITYIKELQKYCKYLEKQNSSCDENPEPALSERKSKPTTKTEFIKPLEKKKEKKQPEDEDEDEYDF